MNQGTCPPKSKNKVGVIELVGSIEEDDNHGIAPGVPVTLILTLILCHLSEATGHSVPKDIVIGRLA